MEDLRKNMERLVNLSNISQYIKIHLIGRQSAATNTSWRRLCLVNIVYCSKINAIYKYRAKHTSSSGLLITLAIVLLSWDWVGNELQCQCFVYANPWILTDIIMRWESLCLLPLIRSSNGLTNQHATENSI